MESALSYQAGAVSSSPAIPPAIEIYDVHKAYGPIRALDGLTLTVRSGEIFGLLGPNGAGKSTTIKLINGLLTADSGSVRVFGVDPAESGRLVRSMTGYVMQETTFDKHLSATENLRMYAELFGMRRKDVARHVREALAWAGLTEAADRPLASYSGGMRRRFILGERHWLEVELKMEEPFWPDDLPLTARQITTTIWHFEGQPSELFLTAAALYEKLGTSVRSVRYVEPTLEDVFLRLTEQDDTFSLPS